MVKSALFTRSFFPAARRLVIYISYKFGAEFPTGWRLRGKKRDINWEEIKGCSSGACVRAQKAANLDKSGCEIK